MPDQLVDNCSSPLGTAGELGVWRQLGQEPRKRFFDRFGRCGKTLSIHDQNSQCAIDGCVVDIPIPGARDPFPQENPRIVDLGLGETLHVIED